MTYKRLNIPAVAALTLIIALVMASGAYAAKTGAKAERGHISDKMADLTVTGLPDITIDCAQPTDAESTGYPSVSGDYPPFEMTYVDMIMPGDVPSEYTITRVWTVTDVLGNERVRTQTITVVDDEPPVITCPPDVTFECDAIGDYGEATATDNSQLPPLISYRDSITWQRCEHEYIMIRTWTATDRSGNSSSCDQTININDSTPPVIVCPNDTTVACSEIGNLPHAQAWDNCVEDLHMDYEPVRVEDDERLKFVLIRTWEVTDGCCNKVGCYQRVTLIDTIPPVLECAPDDTISCQEIPIFTDPIATDDCEPRCEIEALSGDHSTDPATGIETFTRCWIAYDHAGNASETCCQTIVRLPCDGETCTFTQGGWGNGCPKPQQGDPMSTQPGCIRDHYFGDVFGQDGVTIGIPAGSTHGATWASASAVEDFLPAGGTSGPLTGDLTDPTSTPAGVLAGQILALRLNREYSCAGIFNIALNPTAGCLGTMMIPEDCEGKFGGMTVDAFLAIADLAIAGVPGVLDAYGAGFSDLNETATCLNEYYDNCGDDEEDQEPTVADPSIPSLAGAPAEFAIESVTPNPMKSSTTIRYGLPSEGRVRVEVFNIQGRKVAGLVDQHMSAGYHGVMWNGRDGAGNNTSQGVYFCRIKLEDRPAIMHKLIKVE
jgi:hypothetical protein